MQDSDFIFRFAEVCGTSEPTKVALLFNISYNTAKNYLAGRYPNVNILQMIAETTPYSIHWLLTGEGEKFVDLDYKNLQLNDELKDFIREVCAEAMSHVSDEIKLDKQEEKFILSPDKIKQEKMLENSEFSESEEEV